MDLSVQKYLIDIDTFWIDFCVLIIGKEETAMKFIKAILLTILCTVILNINAGSSYVSTVDFYGHPLTVSYDQQLTTLQFSKMDQAEIDRNLSMFRNTNLNNSIISINKHVENYKLDDAGTLLFIDKYATKVSGSSNKNAHTFIKYILLKELDYDVILTKTGTRLNCMGNLSFTPGRYIYIMYGNKNYKDLDFKNRKNYGQHLVYKDKKRSTKQIARNLFSTPRVNANQKSKALYFAYGLEKFEIQAQSNASITEFLGDLPMFEVGHEFTDLRMSNEMQNSVVSSLREKVAGRDKVDQVKLLLAFVQQVVPYGSDYAKFGEERFYYPEETIMATTADCEDKALLLSYLCKEILGFKTVGLFFKKDEHISLGIEIPGYTPSGSFRYAGKTYVSCEPTARFPHLTYSEFSLQRIDQVIDL
jgi:hypothetical protein